MSRSFQVGKSTFLHDVESNIAPEDPTIVLFETGGDKIQIIDYIIATGTADAEFTIKFNSVTIIRYRTSEQDRTMRIPCGPGWFFKKNDTIEVSVEHCSSNNQSFNVSMGLRIP